MDYSCYVTFENDTKEEIRVDRINITSGYWETSPCHVIPPVSTNSYHIKDYPGPWGSEASIDYIVGGREIITLHFKCPSIDNNKVDFRWKNQNQTTYECFFYAGVNDKPMEKNSVPQRGHPVYVIFTILSKASGRSAKKNK